MGHIVGIFSLCVIQTGSSHTMCVKLPHVTTACLLLIQKEQKRLSIHKHENSKDIYMNILLPWFFMFSFSHKRWSQNTLLVPLDGHCFNPWVLNTCPDSSANGQTFTEHYLIGYSSLFKLWVNYGSFQFISTWYLKCFTLDIARLG